MVLNSKFTFESTRTVTPFNSDSKTFQMDICIIDFAPLSMTVGGCRLLPNEMAGVVASGFVRLIDIFSEGT